MAFAPYSLKVRRFLLAKEGATPVECEDAIAINHRLNRFAIADGATEAYDARRWARLLARRWVHGGDGAATRAGFGALLADLGPRLHARWHRRPLPWYAEEKARAGSFAAFAGIEFAAAGGALHWRAVALGDACLIHWRGDALGGAWPLSDPEAFDARPILAPSLASLQAAALAHTLEVGGRAAPGDVFLLLSDAVAAWYLRASAKHSRQVVIFESLLEESRDADLTEFIARERLSGAMANDDVAVVKIRIG
jgi:hypothetical protein